jgi:hypothetical protein
MSYKQYNYNLYILFVDGQKYYHQKNYQGFNR